MQTHQFQDTSWSLQSKIKGYISGELYLSTIFYDLDLWWKKKKKLLKAVFCTI